MIGRRMLLLMICGNMFPNGGGVLVPLRGSPARPWNLRCAKLTLAVLARIPGIALPRFFVAKEDPSIGSSDLVDCVRSISSGGISDEYAFDNRGSIWHHRDVD